MNQRHIIENAIIDLSFGSEAEALEQQSGLSEFVKQRLMAVVERVLDEMSEPDRVFRIEQLDLDLGTVPYQGYEEELEIRLEQRLRELLREKLDALQWQANSSDAVITPAQSQQEQLEYYLLHGRLPWHAGLGPDQSIDQLLEQAVRSNRSNLVAFLRSASGRPMVIRRLVRQFPDHLLAEIAGSTAPSQGSFLASLIEDFPKLWRLGRFVAATEREFKSLLWEQIYQQILKPGQSRPDSQEFIGQIVTGLAEQSRGSSARLLDTPAQAAGQLAAGDSVGPELTRFIQGLARQESTGAGVGEAESNVPPESRTNNGYSQGRSPDGGLLQGSFNETQVWQRRLEAALLGGNARLVEEIWPVLLRDHPELVKEVFLQRCRPVQVRRGLASRLPEAMLSDLAGLFLPDARGLIQELLENQELLLSAIGLPTAGADSLKTRIWEFILSYLLVEGGDRLNKRNFVDGLLHRLESQSSRGDRSRLPPASGEPRSDAVLSQETGELHDLLQDRSGAVEGVPTLQPDYESASADLAHSYELYHLLRQEMVRTSLDLGETDGPIQLIDQLARLYPWQLLKLFRELQSVEGSAFGMTSGLSTAALGYLIQSILALPQPVSDTGPSDLMQAIEAYAGQAWNLREYYQQVLACLLEDRVIDFDAIRAATQSADQTTATTTGGAEEPATASENLEARPLTQPMEEIPPVA
ncbi:MAG: contractile injection system tape measure protein, partial [Dehalococcoidia bacterium]